MRRNSELYSKGALLLSGILIAIPGVLAAFSTTALSTLYGVASPTETEVVLLRHRGVILALLGCLLIYSMFVRRYRTMAIVIAIISNSSFATLALFYKGSLSDLSLISLVDIVLTLLLVVALIINRRPHDSVQR